MNKFYGAIGYGVTSETVPGVWTDAYTEKMYYGDLIKVSKRNENNGNLNKDIVLSNQVSVIADPYAQMNFQFIKYVTINGVKWEVTTVTLDYHRLILDLGGVFNA